MNKELQASDKEKAPRIQGQTQKTLTNSRILEWKLTESTDDKYWLINIHRNSTEVFCPRKWFTNVIRNEANKFFMSPKNTQKIKMYYKEAEACSIVSRMILTELGKED